MLKRPITPFKVLCEIRIKENVQMFDIYVTVW